MLASNQNKSICSLRRVFLPSHLPLFLFVWMPLLIMLFAGEKESGCRIMILLIILPSATCMITWWAVSRKTQIIPKDSKLRKHKNGKIPLIVSMAIRCGALCIALIFAQLTIRYFIDVLSYINGGPVLKAVGTVEYNSNPFGIWFMSQTLSFKQDVFLERKYYYLFSMKSRIKIGSDYEVVILPRSRIVLKTKLYE